jgi:hypothetical protein
MVLKYNAKFTKIIKLDTTKDNTNASDDNNLKRKFNIFKNSVFTAAAVMYNITAFFSIALSHNSFVL